MQFQEPTKGYAGITDDAAVPMVTATPAAEGVDHNGIVVGKWKAGIFQCYWDCIPNGFMSFICPGVSLAQIGARLGLVNYYAMLSSFAALYILAIVAAATNNDVVVTLIVIASLLMALFVARLRSRVRYLFSLPGSVLEDVFYACMCGCCAIAQMATHVESYQPGDCTIAPRATLPGYSFN